VESDWSVECGANDPWVVVPWSGKDRAIRYIDLRAAPERLMEIPEAARFPSIAEALRQWNKPESALYTAKCDVWSYTADLFDANDLPGFACAHASYIDLLTSQRQIFADFAAAENLLRRWSASAQHIRPANCRAEWILRRARILPAETPASAHPNPVPLDGFAATLYVWGYGNTSQEAEQNWARSLMALIEPVLAEPHLDSKQQ
jgi:hypothetical protein